MRTKLIVAVVVAVLGSLGSVPSSASASGQMSLNKAQNIYLKNICRVNDADGRLWKAVFRGRDHVDTKDITKPWMRRINKALAVASRKFYVSGRNMLNPPAAWPDGTQSKVRKVARNLIGSSSKASNARSTKPRRFVRKWNASLYPAMSKGFRLSRNARAALDLPPNGKGC